jgi:hypothetical protein
MIQATYQDGSTSKFDGSMGGATHVGGLAIERMRLKMAKIAIETKLNSNMEVTRNGCKMAIEHVIAPLTGKTYARSRKGKEEALADCIAILAEIEGNAVVSEVQ